MDYPDDRLKGELHQAPIEITNNQLALDPVLQFFHYAHLPPKLQTTSHQFFMLASFIVNNLPRNAERTVALRKLLEAKDAAVRANLPPPGFGQTKPPVASKPYSILGGDQLDDRGGCRHPLIYAPEGALNGRCTFCEADVRVKGYAQSARWALGFLTLLPQQTIGESMQIGDNEDSPMKFED